MEAAAAESDPPAAADGEREAPPPLLPQRRGGEGRSPPKPRGVRSGPVPMQVLSAAASAFLCQLVTGTEAGQSILSQAVAVAVAVAVAAAAAADRGGGRAGSPPPSLSTPIFGPEVA